MNTKEKLNVLNELRAAKDEKPLKSWSKSVKALDERLAAYGFNAGAAPKAKAKVKAKAKAKAPAKVKATAKAPKMTIASVCRRMINEGAKTEAIHAELLKTVANYAEEKKWYITWYRSDIKRKAAKAA